MKRSPEHNEQRAMRRSPRHKFNAKGSSGGKGRTMTVVRYVDSLARSNSEALSFIPYPKLEHYAERGQIITATENDDLCGFLVHGNGYPVCRIYQACVQYDARRMEHGMAMVHALVQKAERRGCVAISLWCADDLDANVFWRAAGFEFAGQREGGRRRGRKHNRWVLWLRTSLWSRAD